MAPGAPAKHANAAPELAEPAAKTSGYDPARTFVIMPPDEKPMTKTRDASPLYCCSVYSTMLTMPRASPPCPCVRLAALLTSQQLLKFGVSG